MCVVCVLAIQKEHLHSYLRCIKISSCALIKYLLIIEYTLSWQLFWTQCWEMKTDNNGIDRFLSRCLWTCLPPFLVLRVWPTVTDFPTAPKAIKSTSDWSGMEISFFMIRMFDLAKMLHHMPFLMQRSPPARGVPCLFHFYGNVPFTHSIVVSSNTPVTGMP